MNVNYIVTGNVVNLVIGDKHYVVGESHPANNTIIQYLKDCFHCQANPESEFLVKLLDVKEALLNYSDGALTIVDGKFYYKGEECIHQLNEVIINCFKNKQPFEHLIKFMNKLYANPDDRCIAAFWSFVSRCGLSITTEGDVLGYKSVRKNYMDHFSGKYNNKPGAHIFERRVGDVGYGETCGTFFHIGTLGYANSFHSGESNIVLCKFSPTDVVSVPSESSEGKIRVCSYHVVCDYNNQGQLKDTFYSVVDNSVKESLSENVPSFDEDCSYSQEDEDDVYDDDEDDHCYDCGEYYDDCTCWDDDDDYEVSNDITQEDVNNDY